MLLFTFKQTLQVIIGCLMFQGKVIYINTKIQKYKKCSISHYLVKKVGERL